VQPRRWRRANCWRRQRGAGDHPSERWNLPIVPVAPASTVVTGVRIVPRPIAAVEHRQWCNKQLVHSTRGNPCDLSQR
jgi:hypothetical protein